MTEGPSFILQSQLDDFRKSGRFIQRTIVEKLPIYIEGSFMDHVRTDPPGLLTVIVKKKLKDLLLAPGNRKFECVCIEVEDDDGMSWSAESVYETIKGDADLSKYHTWSFRNERPIEHLPVIAEFIGLKTFLKLAVRNRMTTDFPAMRSWVSGLIVLGALLIGVAVKIVELWLKVKEPVKGDRFDDFVRDPALYLTTTVFVSLGLLSQFLINRQNPLAKPSPKERFISKYDEILKDLESRESQVSHHFNNFIESMAAQLQFCDRARIVIIDNFGNLDFTTRRVIERYFEKYASSGRVSECWIIFESKEGNKFSGRALVRRGDWGYLRTALYHQQFLNKEERLALAREIGKPEAAAYVRVKMICFEDADVENRIYQLIAGYRALHPARENQYGALEMLYLLSLTSLTPGDISFSINYLKSNLSTKNLLRSEVLSMFLRGTGLGLTELKDSIDDVHAKFGSLLDTDEVHPLQRFRVQPEAAHVLSKFRDELRLPDPKLGHLFWALFWYDKYDRQGREAESAFKSRKLSSHVLRSGIAAIRDATRYNEIRTQLFEAHLVCFDECLRNCLMGDLHSLLDRAFDLLREEDLTAGEKQVRRLLKKYWECYSVLGDEDLLDSIVTIQTALGITAGERSDTRPDVLERLFFESLPLSDARRKRLTAGWDWERRDGSVNESIEDYSRARATWLAFIGSYLVKKLERSLLIESAKLGEEQLTAVAGRTIQRIREGRDTSARVTDIISLSTVLHCQAFNLDHHLKMPSLIGGVHRQFLIRILEVAEDDLEVWLTKVEDVCSITEHSVFLAAELKGGAVSKDVDFLSQDFLVYALARMIFVDASITAMTILNYLQHFSPELPSRHTSRTDKIRDEVETILDLCNEQLGWRIRREGGQSGSISEDRLKEIEKSIKLTEYLLQLFGLHKFSVLNGLKRVYFKTLFDFDHADSDEFAKESIGAAIDQVDVTGVMANLLIASAITRNHELSATYLCKSASLAISGGLGPRIRQEISLVAILNSHSYAFDLTEFLDQVLLEDASHTNTLTRHMSGLDNDQIMATLLTFLNVSGMKPESESAQKTVQTLKEFIEGVDDEDIRGEGKKLIEYFDLRSQLARGESPDFTEILGRWEDRKSSWIYPAILNLLMSNGCDDQEMLKDAVRLLDRDGTLDGYTTYFNLGLNLARMMVTDGNFDTVSRSIIRKFLEGSISRWEGEVTAESHIGAYEVLGIMDPGNKEYYYSKVLEWQIKKMRRDTNKRYPDMLRSGNYFPVFSDYYNIMRYYGLGLDMPENEYWNHLRSDPDQIRSHANGWKNGGANIPRPLERAEGRVVLSGEFLILGHCLYSPPVLMDGEFDEHRKEINMMAQRYFPSLLDVIGHITGLPQEIKELISDFAERLTGIIELDE